jgi:hypothetical protein
LATPAAADLRCIEFVPTCSTMRSASLARRVGAAGPLFAAAVLGLPAAWPADLQATERSKGVEIPPGHVLPAEYLASLPAPVFAPGHTLPRLTRYGWTLDFDTRVEIARRWGYALEWGSVPWLVGYATAEAVDAALADPKNDAAKCMRLAEEEPETFKLSVVCCRTLPPTDAVPPETWTRDAEGKFVSHKTEGYDGNIWSDGVDRIYSPAAPDSVWQEAGRLRAEPLKKILEKCPIEIVLNGGEYGLGAYGSAKPFWERDPTILAAKGKQSWYEYTSQAKARAESIIADAVRKAVPNRSLYIYYTCSGGGSRNRWPGWVDWGPGYEWFHPVSDLASGEHYYRHANSGWTGGDDILTQALNARGFEIAHGSPFCYDWLSAGWVGNGGMGSGTEDRLGDEGLGDLERYRGFLKCMYTAGMVGGNAGYYAYPKGYERTPLQGFAQPFPPDRPPHWILQITALAEVHALFSRLEPFIRKGDLLPGPARHRWSKEKPVYEFPTGHADTRVVARKMKGKPEWLITAWAADGVVRVVTVDIPELGKVDLAARPAGTVCTATLVASKPALTTVDVQLDGARTGSDPSQP